MRGMTLAAAIAALLSLLAASGSTAASLEEVGSFEQPIYVTSDPSNPGRLFVAEREGALVEVHDDARTDFADLRSLVACCEEERGLLSLAPAPDFAKSGRFYAAYTGTTKAGGKEGDVHLDAFGHEGGALVREPILTVPHSAEANHNGGQLQFGPDGHLYVSLGDGGGGGDPFDSGQDLETLLGKVIRIDPRPGQSPSYLAPAGNPYLGLPGRDEIWSYGLRNPWRFSFDRAGGDMIIAEVGQDAREEIDVARSPGGGAVGGAGANYGWDCREGLIEFSGDSSPACEGAGGFTDPVFDYPHQDPGDGSAHGCAITGGYVVRDPALGDLFGRYLYGDFCVGDIRSIDLSAPDPASTDRTEPGLSLPPYALYSFGEDSCGRVYVVSGIGPVYRIVGDRPTDCAQPGSASNRGARKPRISLRGRLLRRGGSAATRALVIARVRPCAGNRGRRLALKRGGRRVGEKKLNRRCLTRFRERLRHRSTFRAVLRATRAAKPVRSKRLVIGPSAR